MSDRGGRLVGSGIPEQIQHHGRRLQSIKKKLTKLAKKHATLIKRAQTLQEKAEERGEPLNINHPTVQRLQEAFANLEENIRNLENQRDGLEALLDQLHHQQMPPPLPLPKQGRGIRRLVGAGIPEQIQHHERRLEKAHASLMRLIKKKNKLLTQAQRMVDARNARGEGFDHEAAQRFRDAMDDIENKISGRRDKIADIAAILENLQAQLP